MSGNSFFTGDPHFGHNNILKYCRRMQFLTEDECRRIEETDKLRERIEQLKAMDHLDIDPAAQEEYEASCKRVDELDFRPSDESTWRMNVAFYDSINQVVGEDDVLWIMGDFCFAQKDKWVETAGRHRQQLRCRTVNHVWGNHDDRGMAKYFTASYDLVRVTVRSQKIVMCHYPLAVWDNSYRGDWMLYGHCHTTAEVWLESIMPHRKSMDVGVDNAKKLLGEYRPFSFDEIAAIMKERMGHTVFRKTRGSGGGETRNRR